MLTLQIKEKEIENLTPEEEFIRGTVGAKCQINFDEFWQGYEKYIVFKRVGYEPINIMVDSLENEIEIPYTILAEIGEFKIGVFGITETETLPTLYSKDIKILYGTDTHGTTPPTYTPSEIDQLRLLKQDKLVSGENIKTINNQSILGSGNITIEGGSDVEVDQNYNPESENAQSGKAVAEAVAIEQKRSDNTFANALKSSKSGSAILIDDISPVTHEMSVKISSDTVTDLTAVKVTRCGKNLIPFPYSQLPIGITTLNGIEFTVYEDGSILMNGTATTGFSRYLYGNTQDLLGLRAGDIITGSKWVSDDSQIANFNLTFNYYNIDGDMKEGVINLKSQQNLTTTITEDYVGWGIYIYISSGKTFDNLLFKPQLELGKTATDYEPYVEPTEYTPTADGTVNGVTSLYPNTSLTTDTDGVIIDCEYNKDTNKFSGVDVNVPTKTSELINDSNFATQDYVDEEIANFDFIKIVTELPETGLVNRTYFVPKQDPATNDLYDEYMWVDGKWELITTKQIEVDLTEYIKHTDINQTYSPDSENAQSGKAVKEALTTLGGHYETVVEEIWQRNKIFTPVSFDYENQVITVSDGELDEYSIGDKIYCIIVPNISGCTLNSLSGRLGTKTLTVLSATELSVSDALHADTTVANFHFETVANYFLLAKNLSAKKIRVTVNGASSVPNNYYHADVFYGINAGNFYADMVGYVNNSLPLRSSMRLETEIISPYTIFNQFSIGYNCASSFPNYHWKNNGAAWATGYMTKVPHKQYLFNGDGTKIENLWRTTAPWFCDENGQSQVKYNHPYMNTTLHICNGTYIKIERWVE